MVARLQDKPRKGGFLTQFFAKNSDANKGEIPFVEQKQYVGQKTYFQDVVKAHWSPRNYEKFADEAYVRNPIAHRSIHLISQSVANVEWELNVTQENVSKKLHQHPLLSLLYRPNPCCSGVEFFESLVSYLLINGNAFVLKVQDGKGEVGELHLLRPDRVEVVVGSQGVPQGYRYKVGDEEWFYPVDAVSGRSKVLHIKYFHPLSDWYGLSPIESAATSIDQHNQASVWNQALLQNGAKPSGALIVNVSEDLPGGTLSDEQYMRIRQQVDEQFSGSANAGRPLLLEGGMDWKEMSLTPKDMDFIDMKHSAARDIALSFGVPPQLLGIPGDNTYSNLVEARLAMWEQTVIPLMDKLCNSLNNWLTPDYGKGRQLVYNLDKIYALSPRREKIWARLRDADYMTVNEKRQAVGLDAIEGGDQR